MSLAEARAAPATVPSSRAEPAGGLQISPRASTLLVAGIGLAGAHQIVEQHGGTIAVDSQEGSGSTFTVRLPLDADASI